MSIKINKIKVRAQFSLIFEVFIFCCVAIFTDILQAEENMPFTLTSTAFAKGDSIPKKFTCEGENISPPLEWQGVPADARSLVLIVDDPDAPDPKAPRMTWDHWVLYNLPSNSTQLPEGVASSNLPSGTKEGLNSWGKTGYGGPCPPIGKHRYFYKLYALNTVLNKMDNPTKAQVEDGMKDHIIAEAELVGTYQKAR